MFTSRNSYKRKVVLEKRLSLKKDSNQTAIENSASKIFTVTKMEIYSIEASNNCYNMNSQNMENPHIFDQIERPVIVEQPRFTRQQLQQMRISSGAFYASNILTTLPKLGPHPTAVFCPACGARNITIMAHTPNACTHKYALILCFVGWCLCACCYPYWMKSCRTGNHFCSECNTFLGSFLP